MTKQIKVQISAWAIYFAFLGFFLVAFFTGNDTLVGMAPAVVWVDLWLFTFIPAALYAGTTLVLRRGAASVQRQMAVAGATSEQVAQYAHTVRPRISRDNFIALLSSAVISYVIYNLGFTREAMIMFGITVVTHSIIMFLPVKKVDPRSPFI